jgi:hypothetical protein
MACIYFLCFWLQHAVLEIASAIIPSFYWLRGFATCAQLRKKIAITCKTTFPLVRHQQQGNQLNLWEILVLYQ